MDFRRRHKGRENEKIEIKPIGEDKIPEILALQADFTNKESFYPITKDELFESIERDVLLGVFLDGELLGFAMWVINRNTPRSLAPRAALDVFDVMSFDGVVIHPRLRGRGLQRALLSIFEEHAKELSVKAVLATVSPTNVYSKANFEALGYIVSGEIDIYSGKRLLMKKELINPSPC